MIYQKAKFSIGDIVYMQKLYDELLEVRINSVTIYIGDKTIEEYTITTLNNNSTRQNVHVSMLFKSVNEFRNKKIEELEIELDNRRNQKINVIGKPSFIGNLLSKNIL